MSRRRPFVVWQAGVAWDGLPGTDRRLVSELVHHVDVLWADPPKSAARSLRNGDLRGLRPRVRVVGPHLTVVSPIAPPGPNRPGISRLTDRLSEQLITKVVRSMARDVDVIVGTSPDPRLNIFAGALRVYYATDDFPAGAALMGKRARRFERIEMQRLAEANVVGAVSPQILERWHISGTDTFVLPNGCDPAHFTGMDLAPAPQDVALPAPVAGLIGQLSPRIDLTLLEAVADAGISLLLVGPRQADFEHARVSRLVARPRVTWVGRKSYDELPSYMQVIDVGLTPYIDDAFNACSFPLKTLEYLSSGRSVVSTPLPAVARLQSPWIRTAGTPEAFVVAVRESVSSSADADAIENKRRFASTHDWSTRARQFLREIGIPVASDGPGVEVVDRETSL